MGASFHWHALQGNTHRRIRQAPQALNCCREDLGWPAGRRGTDIELEELGVAIIGGARTQYAK